jgi:ubiquitin-protein ligase
MNFISSESINRLLKDVRHIMKNPLTDNGIYYIHDDTDMLKGYALIIGPEDTPYFGGNYFFEFNYPNDYPFRPPVVTYHTNAEQIRFNPNLYVSGKVCVSILNTWHGDQWSSCQTISTILLTLCTLLCENPLLNEPGITIQNENVPKYNKIIEYSNINIAVCDILSKKKIVYRDFFESFYPFVKDNFLKNYDKLLLFVDSKIATTDANKAIILPIYSMNVNIDYYHLRNKLVECKKKIE